MMATNRENSSSSMPGSATDRQLNQLTAVESSSAYNKKAVVVGIYGVPGSGKSFLLNQLKQELGDENFAFYEGSEMIATAYPGGLDAFQKLVEPEKLRYRELAIDTIGRKCTESGQAAVVTGHFMFWPEEEEVGQEVCTQKDLDTFTHILYLNTPAETVAQRRLDDMARSRPSMSVTHLRNWQHVEITALRRLCRQHGILFSLLSSQPTTLLSKALTLLRDFGRHSEELNLTQAARRLDDIFGADRGRLDTVLVLDADRTLAAVDTGALFWNKMANSQQPKEKGSPLKTLFDSNLGYSYPAFRQATLLYEETADDQEFDALCQDVASELTMYPEFVSLLQLVAGQEHVGAVVITSGLSQVWNKVLARAGLSDAVQVIGGGRIADGYVVTAAVKAAMVARLRDVYQAYVWAFGDSPLDLKMLSEADQAIVVVGEEHARSKTMDAALRNAIDHGGLRARQTVLPSSASPRLDTTKLPLIQLTDPNFLDAILVRSRHRNTGGIQVLHATARAAAKLLMTPTRDAQMAGPTLREAHRRVGWYLATEFIADLIGLEEYPIPHVQGHRTSGHRLLHEQQTTIVALMRGGEAIALGVNDAFPLAMFVHAGCAEDVQLHHLRGQRTVVLVDSVVNRGDTVVRFVRRVRELCAAVQIVVVAGVAQARSVEGGGSLDRALGAHPRLALVALRLSDNQFTGSGTTDTGNRLFNTTHLR
jgi:uracil phosphoribosyltransferase/phosphoserine phosphatase/adenylate kinase